MLETLRNAWVIKEIRNKIFFTIFIILILTYSNDFVNSNKAYCLYIW